MGMEPRHYGQDNEDLPQVDTNQLPWWLKTPWLIAMSVGPSAATGIILTMVFLGWIPSPMLDAINMSNAQYAEMQKLYTAVSSTQTSVAKTLEETAKASTARDSRTEAMQLKLEALAKGNRMSCRAMAKLLKNQDMNEKCDEL